MSIEKIKDSIKKGIDYKDDYNAIIASGEYTKIKLNKIIETYTSQLSLYEALGFEFNNTSEFVAKALESLSFKITGNGQIKKCVVIPNTTNNPYTQSVQDIANNEQYNPEQVINEIYMLSSDNKCGILYKDVSIAFQNILDDSYRNYKQELFMAINHNNYHNADWKQFVNGLFVNSEYDDELLIAIFKKFIWQVKRKTFGMDIPNALMPIIFGPQQLGKSYAIKKFLSPLGDLSQEIMGKVLGDGKTTSIYKMPVLFIDELGGMDKESPDILKQILTGGKINHRVLGKQMVSNTDIMCSFIGATNVHVKNIIKDETGMRRYVELNLMNKTDHAIINNINYIDLWISVSPYDVDPIIGHEDALKKIQEDIRFKPSYEEFLIDEDMQSILRCWTKSGVLYNSYVNWCQNNGYRPMNRGNFIDAVKSNYQRLNYKMRKHGNSIEFMVI